MCCGDCVDTRAPSSAPHFDYEPKAGSDGVKKTQLAQGAERPEEKLRGHEAASLPLNRRPARVEAAARLRVSRAADMSSRSKRKAHFDQLAKDRRDRGDQPQPPAGCPADRRRSTPDAEQVPGRLKDQRQTSTAGLDRGRRTNVKLQPPDWTEDEGPTSNFVDSARAACEGPTSNSAVSSIPSWAESPCNRDHAPRFLRSETWKNQQHNQY